MHNGPRHVAEVFGWRFWWAWTPKMRFHTRRCFRLGSLLVGWTPRWVDSLGEESDATRKISS